MAALLISRLATLRSIISERLGIKENLAEKLKWIGQIEVTPDCEEVQCTKICGKCFRKIAVLANGVKKSTTASIIDYCSVFNLKLLSFPALVKAKSNASPNNEAISCLLYEHAPWGPKNQILAKLLQSFPKLTRREQRKHWGRERVLTFHDLTICSAHALISLPGCKAVAEGVARRTGFSFIPGLHQKNIKKWSLWCVK